MIRKTSISFAVCALVLLAGTSSFSQTSDPPRFEVGAQFSLLNFDRLDNLGERRRTEIGGGGRFTVNINKYVAAETELNYFPQEDSIRIGTIDVPLWGKKTLVVAGIKAGGRTERVGVFGKARPGFIHFSYAPGFACIALVGVVCNQPKTTVFAVDLGGVFEYYPSRRTVVRFDAGDTIIRQDKRFFDTSHSLQTSIGVGVRF